MSTTVHPNICSTPVSLPQAGLGEHIAKFNTRVFHIAIGTVLTPLEMTAGALRIVYAISRVALAALALTFVKVKKATPERVKQIEIAQKRVNAFAISAARQVRIGSLQLIPIIGAQLANQYKQNRSLVEFIDAPAFGGLLGVILSKIGITIPQIVYGFRGSDLFSEGTNTYRSLQTPTIEDTRRELLASKEDESTLVRIPVTRHDGTLRYHDATMLFAPENKGNEKAKTVVIYHANGTTRDQELYPYGKKYLAQGYNVLLTSYAGDDVIDGKGTSFSTIPTTCSENELREDAEADLAFLKALGVSQVGIYGWSLGGAQGMNFAQAAATSDLQVDFITLNKTFTNAADVTGRAVRNGTRCRFLGRLVSALARRYFADEPQAGRGTRCDCLDNQAKLREIKNAPPFQRTKFTIIGGTQDHIMGEPANPQINFAHELFSEVKDLGESRATLIMEEEGHYP